MSAAHFMGMPCKNGHDGLRYLANSSCVHCTKERSIKTYKADPKTWNARDSEWHKKNREASRAIQERFHAKNPGFRRHLNSKRRADLDQRTPLWEDMEAIRIVYENCPRGMTVDHVIPLRGKLVSGLHVHNNLQYLTGPGNSSKGNRYEPA